MRWKRNNLTRSSAVGWRRVTLRHWQKVNEVRTQKVSSNAGGKLSLERGGGKPEWPMGHIKDLEFLSWRFSIQSWKGICSSCLFSLQPLFLSLWIWNRKEILWLLLNKITWIWFQYSQFFITPGSAFKIQPIMIESKDAEPRAWRADFSAALHVSDLSIHRFWCLVKEWAGLWK